MIKKTLNSAINNIETQLSNFEKTSKAKNAQKKWAESWLDFTCAIFTFVT